MTLSLTAEVIISVLYSLFIMAAFVFSVIRSIVRFKDAMVLIANNSDVLSSDKKRTQLAENLLKSFVSLVTLVPLSIGLAIVILLP